MRTNSPSGSATSRRSRGYERRRRQKPPIGSAVPQRAADFLVACKPRTLTRPKAICWLLLFSMSASSEAYPGSAACAAEVIAMADAYRQAAKLLLNEGRRQAFSRAPATLCAIHAIELYLNALLLHRGRPAAELRGHFHDLAGRAELARAQGLVLRTRTAAHLAKVTRDREYLISRYGPEKLSTLSEVTRLVATLDEIAKKVAVHVGPPRRSPTTMSPAPKPARAAPRTAA
jgi:hypothetical protein